MPAGGVRFPPLMLERMLKYYTRVADALMNADIVVDGQRTGKVSRQQFTKIFKQFSVDVDEAFVQVMDAFDDRTENGGVDHKRFLQAASERLFPPRPANAMSLIIPPSKFFEEKGRGRAKDFPLLKTTWNNEYHQSIDHSDHLSSGKPILHGIMSGKFYRTSAQKKDGPPRKIAGLMMDQSLNQPLSKSLMEGAYYHNPFELKHAGSMSARTKKDFVQKNRTMTRQYSRLVTGARSISSPEILWDRSMATPRSTGPFHKASRPVSQYMRTRGQDISTPRDAGELQELWGRSLDPKFIATTMTWLQKATPEERENFKNAVASQSTLVPSRSAVYPDRAFMPTASGAQKRPWTARSTAGDPASSKSAEEGDGVRKAEAIRPMSARTLKVETEAINAATAFVHARPKASARGTGPERYLTPRTPRMLAAPLPPKASPRPPLSADSPKRATIAIHGTQLTPGAPTQSPRTMTPRARRIVAAAADQTGEVMKPTTPANVHPVLQVCSAMIPLDPPAASSLVETGLVSKRDSKDASRVLSTLCGAPFPVVMPHS